MLGLHLPRTRSVRRLAAAGAAVALVAGSIGVTTVGQAPEAEAAKLSSASKVLDTLAVKGRAPMTGYSRTAYGQAWADTNRNGCDTRNDILKAQGPV